MFKFIRKLILIVFVLALVILSGFIFVGYKGYEVAISDVSLNEKVALLQSKQNYIPLDEMSEDFIDAVISIEDRRFYSHGGIDYIAIIRSTINNFRSKNIVGGGSTITQQLAKGFYFDQSPSYTRKISEAFVANDLENAYSKEEILEMYVNHNYYGDGFYGIYEASMGYFNVHPKDLTLAQAAMLAGLPQAPSRYALSSNFDGASKRQEAVLASMVENNKIDVEEYKQALKEDVLNIRGCNE